MKIENTDSDTDDEYNDGGDEQFILEFVFYSWAFQQQRFLLSFGSLIGGPSVVL